MTQPLQAIQQLFFAHGVKLQQEADWLTTEGGLPAIKAHYTAYSNYVQLDVEVLVDKGVLIYENFAGWDETDALHNFRQSVLHVLLAALWGQNNEQVVTQSLQIGQQLYHIYWGQMVVRGDLPADVPLDALFISVETLFQQGNIAQGNHWVRLFMANVNGQQSFEALLNNVDWLPAKKMLQSLAWQVSDVFYSVRLFIMLVPTETPASP